MKELFTEEQLQAIDKRIEKQVELLKSNNELLMVKNEMMRIDLDDVSSFVTKIVNYLMENQERFDKSTERKEKQETKPRKEISLSTEPPGALATIDTVACLLYPEVYGKLPRM